MDFNQISIGRKMRILPDNQKQRLLFTIGYLLLVFTIQAIFAGENNITETNNSNWSTVVSGNFYQQGTQHKELMFTLKSKTVGGNNNKSTSTILSYAKNPEKKAVIENLTVKNGVIQKYTIPHNQLDEVWTAETKGKRIYFSKNNNKTGIIETEDETLPGNFVVGPTIRDFLQANWSDILSGKSLSIRFDVLDRKETIGLELFTKKRGKFNGVEVVMVFRKPSSFIIAMLVKPLIFHILPDGSKLLYLQGHVLPKKQVGKKWKDLDCDIVYDHSPEQTF